MQLMISISAPYSLLEGAASHVSLKVACGVLKPILREALTL